MTEAGFDFDWLGFGSGFGGSVCALRLAEKGYRVGVLECGRRFRDEDFAKSTYGAKNTLVKNYLWFAERLGATILPERQVREIRPLGPADGSEGYELATEHPGAWLPPPRRPAGSPSARGEFPSRASPRRR